jgi:phosphohistidine phosphatase SixA
MTPPTQMFVVRHAKAGSRSAWSGPDDLRPLTKTGRRQADALADLLAERGVARLVSSPYVRCRETIEPLGRRLGLPIDLADELAEGTPLAEARRLIEKCTHEPTVLCSHGDVIGELLDSIARHGLIRRDVRFEKGSTWVLDFQGDEVVDATYLPPPALAAAARTNGERRDTGA